MYTVFLQELLTSALLQEYYLKITFRKNEIIRFNNADSFKIFFLKD